jgi:predicted deacylase
MARAVTQALLQVPLPDIAPYRRGSAGVDYVTTFESGRPGPHVLINALTHGNEVCGAYAVDWLFRRGVRPARGRLTLSFANVEAYGRFDPARPFDSRYVDEDFNRVWSPEVLGGARTSAELKRARELAAIVASADYLLDLHSMHQSSPALMLCGMQPRAVALARRMGVPRYLVRDPGHESGRRMRDYGAFDDPASARTALLIECGQHWEPASGAIALQACLRLLEALEAVEPEWLAPHLSPRPPGAQQEIEVSGPVTIASRDFHFVREFQGLEVIPRQGTVIARDGAREVATPFDECVLVMPGRNLAPGLTAVRLGRIAG